MNGISERPHDTEHREGRVLHLTSCWCHVEHAVAERTPVEASNVASDDLWVPKVGQHIRDVDTHSCGVVKMSDVDRAFVEWYEGVKFWIPFAFIEPI